MKKTVLLGIGIACCVASVGAAALQNVGITSFALTRSTPSDYTLVLDLDNTPSGLTSSYQNNFVGTVTTANGNSISMNFVNAKSYANGFVELANHGKIYNYSNGDVQSNRIAAVNGIKFAGSGSLLFKPVAGFSGNNAILADMAPISISAGAAKATVPTCDFFELEAGDSGAQITSLELSYTCDSTAYDVKLLNGTYTGKGDDGYTYKLTLSDGSATFASLDKQTNVSYNGTASLSSRTNATLSLSSGSMTYAFTYNGHALTYSSKTGSGPQISFAKVYTIDNFESYSASGQGYTNSTTKYQTQGLRSHYYADYYTGSSSGEIGGSGWPVMTSSNNTIFTSNKGHNSSKGVAFKFSNNTAMRYITMDELYGLNSIVGKGMTLSIWARGAYSNDTLTTNHSANIPVKAYLYTAAQLTPSNHTTAHKEFEFTVNAGDTWQHFEFDIGPGETFYGFGFNTKQTSGSTAYIVFDDIQIYTNSPYATYVSKPANYPEGTFKGTFKTSNLSSTKYNLVIAIGNYSNGLVSVIINDVHDAGATSISFNESTNKITITTTGQYNNKTIGNITGTYSNGTISSISTAGVTFYSASVTRVSASTSFYDLEGTTAQLQSNFVRRYRGSGGGSWSIDTTNEDRVYSNGNHYVSGSSALSLKGTSNSGHVAFSLANDLSSRISVKYINFWVYNPTDSDIDVRIWVYSATGFGTNVELEAGYKTAKAHSWTYCYACHYSNSTTIATTSSYNFQIADLTGSGANLSFDNVLFYA